HSKIANIVMGIAIFAVGWQLGRIMSPYYSEQPIIFQDRQCSACSSSGGDLSSLQQLKEEGVALREGENTSAVAGTASGPQEQQFVASKNSNLFHHVSCSSVARIKPENQAWFNSAQEAKAQGKTPSQCAQELGY
ncbi:MAG: hypothetical protein WEC84_00980, partial [Candidatus Andersenbacteria bacterium]